MSVNLIILKLSKTESNGFRIPFFRAKVLAPFQRCTLIGIRDCLFYFKQWVLLKCSFLFNQLDLVESEDEGGKVSSTLL